MRFFTDLQTKASSLCLLKVDKYHDPRKATKKLLLVDPGVYELKKAPEFKHVALLHELAAGKLFPNEYLSIDYPCDMNLRYTDEFIRKSVENNFKYAHNPHYICTVQCAFGKFHDFKRRFEELRPVIEGCPEKPIGLGNMCRLNAKSQANQVFVRNVMLYLLQNVSRGRWVHIYGAPMWMIKEWVPKLEKRFAVSVDNTKFTKAVNGELKKKYGLNCNKANRDEFFTTYMAEIKNEGIMVEY